MGAQSVVLSLSPGAYFVTAKDRQGEVLGRPLQVMVR